MRLHYFALSAPAIKALAILSIPAAAFMLNAAGNETAALALIAWASLIVYIASKRAGDHGDEGVYVWKEGLFYRDFDPARTVKDASDFYPIAVGVAALYYNVGQEERRELAQEIVLPFDQKIPLFRPSRGTLCGFLRSCALNSAIDYFRKGRSQRRSILTDALRVSQGVPFHAVGTDASDEERLFGPARFQSSDADEDKNELVAMISGLTNERQKAIITTAAVREGLLDEDDIAGISVSIDLSGARERISFSYRNKCGLKTEKITVYGFNQQLLSLRNTAAGAELKRLLVERLRFPAAEVLEDF